VLCQGSLEEQVATTIDFLRERGALDEVTISGSLRVAPPFEPIDSSDAARRIGVVLEKDRDQLSRELLGAAATLATASGARVVAFVEGTCRADDMWGWGADEVVELKGPGVEEDVAHAISQWSERHSPDIVLAPGTTWGREVASRIAAQLGAGLIGDALELDLVDGRLRCLKPACGGSVVAEISSDSPTQMATVRPGVLPLLEPRTGDRDATVFEINMTIRGRVTVTSRWRDDDLEALSRAGVVVGVGMGVAPEYYDEIRHLVSVVGGEMAATRRVTDRGWMPHSRQLGITGRSISPRLYVAIGLSGKLNHLIGLRSAGTILAVNSDVNALVFHGSDIGIVGDWREVLPMLTTALVTRLRPSISGSDPEAFDPDRIEMTTQA
jgi:electron transfer flavoprotein alpha subunit